MSTESAASVPPPAQEFGPKHLELVRQAMIDADLARTTINGRIGKIKRLFRWATKEGLVPASTWHGLSTVDGLKRGRSKAREAKRICCVPDEHVRLTCAMVNDHVRAMIQVQELAGMRSQDIYNLRTGDLDMSGDVWIYTTWTHKNEHHGHDRKIAIGPRAQAILRPFLKIGEPTAFVFTPMEPVRSVRQSEPSPERRKHLPAN